MSETAIRERPILFSAPMVRAILDGRKTQTRRVVKPQPADMAALPLMLSDGVRFATEAKFVRCPYGVPGDRLWVRETWGTGTRPDLHEGWRDGIEYRADEEGLNEHDLLPLHAVALPDGVDLDSIAQGWRPSIHMPRWASRIDLEVVSVRVERLQEIGEEDARAEGIEFEDHTKDAWRGWKSFDGTCLYDTALESFRKGWDSLNAKRAPWSSNPWVWVVEFRRIKP